MSKVIVDDQVKVLDSDFPQPGIKTRFYTCRASYVQGLSAAVNKALVKLEELRLPIEVTEIYIRHGESREQRSTYNKSWLEMRVTFKIEFANSDFNNSRTRKKVETTYEHPFTISLKDGVDTFTTSKLGDVVYERIVCHIENYWIPASELIIKRLKEAMAK